MKTHSTKFLQRRKFFMVLPLLVLPFLTLLFWALGGGQDIPAQATAKDMTGLNLSLPDAHFDKKEIWDKMSLYEIAERDSAKFEEARERDPYFDLVAFKSRQEMQPQPDTPQHKNQLIGAIKKKDGRVVDPNEERVTNKIQELYSVLNQQPVQSSVSEPQLQAGSIPTDPRFTEDVARLEQMMEMMQSGSEPDPEMQQIESVLEKILDIQHPERMKEKLRVYTDKEQPAAFSVAPVSNTDQISLIPQARSVQPMRDEMDSSMNMDTPRFTTIQNGFFGLEDSEQIQQESGNSIPAIIHQTQMLVEGSTVKMRLQNEVTINGQIIPKDQFIYGTCRINDERLIIEINAIRSGTSLLPVSLSVYDLDGIEGVYIPGAITRDVAKQATDNALQNLQLMSLDPSLGQQAASAGIEAAKGLLSKKTKLIKVTVKAGYKILLVDKV